MFKSVSTKRVVLGVAAFLGLATGLAYAGGTVAPAPAEAPAYVAPAPAPAYVAPIVPLAMHCGIGYVCDSARTYVRNSAGECVHNSAWTPAVAVPECEPWLFRQVQYRPAAVAPQPIAEPAPQMEEKSAAAERYAEKQEHQSHRHHRRHHHRWHHRRHHVHHGHHKAHHKVHHRKYHRHHHQQQ